MSYPSFHKENSQCSVEFRYKKVFSQWYPSAAASDDATPSASNGRKEGFRTVDRSDCKGTVRLDGAGLVFRR